MGRKRIEIGADAESRIVGLLARGTPASAIAVELGVSEATAKRRIRELKGKDRKPGLAVRAPAVAPPPILAAIEDGGSAEIEVEVPPDATIDQIDEWLAVAKARAEAASASDNTKAHAEYMRMIIMLIEARRKSAPIPKPDPNDNPDLIEAADRVRERWHKLADSIVRVSNSPVAESIARLLRPGP